MVLHVLSRNNDNTITLPKIRKKCHALSLGKRVDNFLRNPSLKQFNIIASTIPGMARNAWPVAILTFVRVPGHVLLHERCDRYSRAI